MLDTGGGWERARLVSPPHPLFTLTHTLTKEGREASLYKTVAEQTPSS